MVSIRNLHFSYRKKEVFSGLNLDLRKGRIYGLLGRNGTGKSTLLRSIAGLLFPREGSIESMGYNAAERSPAFLQKMFLVPEVFELPSMKLEKWVRYNAPFYPAFSEVQFEKVTAEFQVPLHKGLHELSYGQQKKALISFALATNAPLLLMDEPTNGLDILSKSQFRKIIAGAFDEEKCIIISTHQVKDLENLIDRVTMIDEGRIIFDQDVEAISRRLQFKLSLYQEEVAAAFYFEPSLQGNALVLANTDKEESRIDLEMLYKAVIMQGQEINALFSTNEI